MNGKEELLCKNVAINDIDAVRRLLDEDANPTVISSCGRTAIGIACLNKFHEVLELLLVACAEYKPKALMEQSASSCDGESESKRLRSREGAVPFSSGRDGDSTPEGMEGLQWEDEIAQRQQSQKAKEDVFDDEWSVLYRYYASVIEKTGEMLANTVNAREPHCLDAFQHAPIHYAATVGSYECVELLLKHNAPINMSTNTGYTALHFCVEQPRTFSLILQYRANPNKLTFYDQLAPVHLAARVNAVETIRLLHNAGANINITTLAEQTALHLAITSQNYEAAVELIQCGAKVNLEDEKGLTPLYTAIVLNDYRLANTLLSYGARLLPSQYLLNYTIRNRMNAMTRLLIEAGENVNGRDYIGWTPVLLAINQKDSETIEYLLANGAKVNRTDYVLKELHIAVQQCSSIEEFRRLFGILIRHGVNIDSLNKWGETPLCLAMLMEKYQMAEFLIKEGANVNGGCSLKVKDCMLLVRECSNINLIKIFVNAGLKMYWPSLIANFDRRNCSANTAIQSCESYLAEVATNPLSLKQCCRIEIRKLLMAKMKDFGHLRRILARTASDQLVFKHLVLELNELPRVLHEYLYVFPDVPRVPDY